MPELQTAIKRWFPLQKGVAEVNPSSPGSKQPTPISWKCSLATNSYPLISLRPLLQLFFSSLKCWCFPVFRLEPSPRITVICSSWKLLYKLHPIKYKVGTKGCRSELRRSVSFCQWGEVQFMSWEAALNKMTSTGIAKKCQNAITDMQTFLLEGRGSKWDLGTIRRREGGGHFPDWVHTLPGASWIALLPGDVLKELLDLYQIPCDDSVQAYFPPLVLFWVLS